MSSPIYIIITCTPKPEKTDILLSPFDIASCRTCSFEVGVGLYSSVTFHI